MRGGDGHQDGVPWRRPWNINPVTTMKIRILALAVLSLVGWALSTSNASAFCLLPNCFHKNYSVIICRPYNAFTPMCYGNVVCDGCCPSPYCGGGACQPPIQRCLPPIYNTGCCDTSCCDNGCCYNGYLPSAPAYAAAGPAMMMPPPGMQMPGMQPLPSMQPPVPMPNNQEFTPPPPTPAPNPVYNQTSMRWNPQGNYVQPAGYYPGYYPAYPMNYYPMNYYPVNNYPVVPSMPAPSYWYNGQ